MRVITDGDKGFQGKCLYVEDLLVKGLSVGGL